MNFQSKEHSRFNRLPLVLIFTLSLVMAGGLFWMSRISTASANFPDYQLAETTYPNLVSTRIDSCSLCHTSAPNLNAYGAAYQAKGRGAATSLTGIENADSDQDGATNIQEILALTFPGDSSDFPAAPAPTKTASSSSYPPPATTTATATVSSYPPPAVSTATKVAATATSVGPTATRAPATATQVGPTATKVAATATRAGPTATRQPATATKAGPTATQPVQPTATRPAVSETKGVKGTRTPGVRPTPVVQCVRKNDDDKDKSSNDSAENRHSNPCPPGYHPRGGDWESRKGDNDFFKQILQRLNSLLQGKKKP